MSCVATQVATSGAWQTFLLWATDVDPQSHVSAFGCCVRLACKPNKSSLPLDNPATGPLTISIFHLFQNLCLML